MFIKPDKNKIRIARHRRIRNHIIGSANKPRLCVFRSIKNISAQLIDDTKGFTIVAASSVEKDFNGYGGNVEAAKKVGAAIAKKALDKGISEVVFDRGGYLYHGRIAALAQAARDAGLKF